ncbi:hypothetical protein QAD02_007150 [Eretmocerus hayati]|uniref:Uncharacterized protein n=1 Tax=Eretmocerus hayati TaxID=131215 RepID=A0ACC2N3D6_9HYME|nr:hypothetical protein QAD02_007150 [Eretmocerus hayati]
MTTRRLTRLRSELSSLDSSYGARSAHSLTTRLMRFHARLSLAISHNVSEEIRLIIPGWLQRPYEVDNVIVFRECVQGHQCAAAVEMTALASTRLISTISCLNYPKKKNQLLEVYREIVDISQVTRGIQVQVESFLENQIQIIPWNLRILSGHLRLEIARDL